MRVASIVLLCIIVFSCKDNDKKDAELKNNDSTIDPLRNEDSSSIFSNNVSLWLDSSLHLEGKRKKMSVEQRWTDDSVQRKPFKITTSFIDTYKTVLRWSPDSSNILDLGSYGLIAIKDKQGAVTLEGGEADTEVALIDTKNNTRTRLIFAGPAAKIIDGRWLNDKEAIIVGTFQNDVQSSDTLMWKIDLEQRNFSLYNITTGIK
jgi:hypothetical protein